MDDAYLTIADPVEGFFKDRGSKFYSFAFPVQNEEELNSIIKSIKKKYFDARHHCYAFRLGADKNLFRASDDGEPSNSSGPPILAQIRAMELTDVLVVVVRYFGGTHLGIPGLINAYRTATKEALVQAEIITKYVEKGICLHFAYPQLNDVMRILKEEDIKPAEQDFTADCRLWANIRLGEYDRVVDRFQKIHTIQVEEID